jgi:hypothetical protein
MPALRLFIDRVRSGASFRWDKAEAEAKKLPTALFDPRGDSDLMAPMRATLLLTVVARQHWRAFWSGAPEWSDLLLTLTLPTHGGGTSSNSDSVCGKYLLTVALQSRMKRICFDILPADRADVVERLKERYETKLPELGIQFNPKRLRELVGIYFPDLRSIANQVEFSSIAPISSTIGFPNFVLASACRIAPVRTLMLASQEVEPLFSGRATIFSGITRNAHSPSHPHRTQASRAIGLFSLIWN